jgi:hypothetical protein
MASSIQGFTSLSINLDKSKTDLETAKLTIGYRLQYHLWDAIEIREGLLFKKFHRKDDIEVYTQLLVMDRLVKPCMELTMSIALL